MTQQLETLPTERTKDANLRAGKGRWRRGPSAGADCHRHVPRLTRQHDALAAVREAPATHPVVTLIQAKQGEPTSELLLPGNIEPLYSANLYARIDGTWIAAMWISAREGKGRADIGGDLGA